MLPRCKSPKYKPKKNRKPVVGVKKPPAPRENRESSGQPRHFYDEEEIQGEELTLPEEDVSNPPRNPVESLREWVEKQRFIPQDLSDDFLILFLSAAGYVVEKASERMLKYFYSRQEPSPLFTNRDPLSPENEKILRKLYVLPMPDTTQDGRKIILTGLVEPVANYRQIDHAKILAMVLDLLIWEKDFGFGDFVVVLDGRGFDCPQLLENKVYDRGSIKKLLQDAIPGTLRAFYLLYPPPHLKKVADTRDGIWMTVVNSKQELIDHLPADILPLEFGGNLGHLEDLLEQWFLHLFQSREFFLEFEKRMTRDYRRRLCHEEEVREGGEHWVHKMKLEADEWEYKIQYYRRMKEMEPLRHPAFGTERLSRVRPTKPEVDPMEKCRKLAKKEAEADLLFASLNLYSGYAKEIRRAKLEEEREKLEKAFQNCVSFAIRFQ